MHWNAVLACYGENICVRIKKEHQRSLASRIRDLQVQNKTKRILF